MAPNICKAGDRHDAKDKRIATPWHDHTYWCEVVSPLPKCREGGPLCSGSWRVLFKVECRGVLWDPSQICRAGICLGSSGGMGHWSSSAMCLPTHYGEVTHTDGMSWGVAMVIYEGGCPEMFLQSVTKRPSWLSYLLTVYLGTPKPIDYPTFLCDLFLVFRGHQEVSNGFAMLKMNLYSNLSHIFLKHLPRPLEWRMTMEMLRLLLLQILVPCLCRLCWASLTLYLWLMLILSLSKDHVG